MIKTLLIAVDGTAASGKGTLAKRLGEHFNIDVLDTGLLYRAVGQKMLDDGEDLENEVAALNLAKNFQPLWLEISNLRTARAGKAASIVARYIPLRETLRKFQQDFANQPGGAVLDGRDIGSVIAPHANVKFWIDAKNSIRAARRYKELIALGEQVNEEIILQELIARDERDAPNMLIAQDAIRIDTSELNADEVFQKAIALIEQKNSIS